MGPHDGEGTAVRSHPNHARFKMNRMVILCLTGEGRPSGRKQTANKLLGQEVRLTLGTILVTHQNNYDQELPTKSLGYKPRPCFPQCQLQGSAFP